MDAIDKAWLDAIKYSEQDFSRDCQESFVWVHNATQEAFGKQWKTIRKDSGYQKLTEFIPNLRDNYREHIDKHIEPYVIKKRLKNG